MFHPVRLFVVAASLLLVGGCQTTVNTTERAQPVGQRQLIDEKRVLTDPSLSRAVGIVAVNESTTPSGFLQVQVEVLNRTRSLKSFNYKFEWFDAVGMAVGSTVSAFIPKQIEGRESAFITGVAPTVGAKDFRIKFIESAP